MSDIKRVGDLEIGQDLRHHALEMKIERGGWIVMALILVAALVGLLGPGPLSSATAGEKGSPLAVEYNRFERYQSPNQMRVHIGAGASRDGKARLWVNREFIENIQLRNIDPEPESIEATADRFVYLFNLPDANSPSAVSFHFEPNKFWQMPVRVGLEGGAEVSFSQFYYP